MKSESLGTTWLTRVRIAVAGATLAALALVGGLAATAPEVENNDTTEEAYRLSIKVDHGPRTWARATWS